MRAIRRRPNVVSTPKTTTAIPAANPIRRDLIIQSALDPHVRFIEFVHKVVHRGLAVTAKSIVVHRDDGRYLMDLRDESPERTAEDDEALELGLRKLGIERREIDRAEVRREPRFGNARRIWEHRNDRPPVRYRQPVIDALSEFGPLSMRELEKAVTSSSDVFSTVCALACEDLVEIDIDSRPLGSETLVRLRR